MTRRTITILSGSLFGLMFLWGIYTFIVYLGVPAHNMVYMSQEQLQVVSAACGDGATSGVYWCRGWQALWPFLSAVWTTARPFHTYIIFSLIVYGIVVFWRGYAKNRFVFTTSVRPWYLLAAFLLSAWLIGTLITTGSVSRDAGGISFRTVIEPLPQVYSSLGPEALQVLQENYDDLKERGCLVELGQADNGAIMSELRVSCMQLSFLSHLIINTFLLLFLVLNFLAVGRLILKALRTETSPLIEFVLSLGLGSFAWVAFLWFIAVFHILIAPVAIAAFVLVPVVVYPHSLYWLRSFARTEWETTEEGNHVTALLVWLLISYLALNFLNVLRPFPIGWDDLGSYMNRPKLLSSYGAFIPQMATFQWEYLSSLAFSMFGSESSAGATFAMVINWFAGLFSVFALFVFGRTFFGARAGLLAAILYYFLPMVGHFSFADMKIDNASFAISVLAVFAALLAARHLRSEEERHETSYDLVFLLIAGVLAGFGFGIKATGVLTILLILSVLSGASLGVCGFIAATFFGFLILDTIGPLSFYDVAQKIGIAIGSESRALFERIIFIILLLGTGIAAAVGVLRGRREEGKMLVRGLAAFGVGIFVAVLPWMIHNAVSHGRVNPSTVLGYNDSLVPYIDYRQMEDVPDEIRESGADVRTLNEELKLDPKHAACTGSSRVEELDRYWGFGDGISHYAGLPWRAVMNTNIVGYYVTVIPALLLLPLVFLLPYFWRREARWFRLLSAGTFIFLVQWILVGNGIMWYGIGMFLGFVLMLEAFVAKAPDSSNRILASVLLTGSIFVCLVNRMWQFDVQRNLFEYPLGKATAEVMREVTIPYYDDIRDKVLDRHASMPERPYTYRVGTFIAYFIPKNKEVIPNADHQLQFFNCLNQEKDHALTLRRLQHLGFNSIIFDTNTATIEKDLNGTLHQKVNAFLDFANDPSLGLSLPINDAGAGIVFIELP